MAWLSTRSVAWAAHPRTAEDRLGTAGTEVPRGMATTGRRSGLAGSAAERCTSEAVARRAWLSQRASARGDRRAYKKEYVDELIFFYLEIEERGLRLVSRGPLVRLPGQPLPSISF